jgi:hypothetical protein
MLFKKGAFWENGEGRRQKAEGGRLNAKGRRQKAESSMQKAEGRRRKAQGKTQKQKNYGFCWYDKAIAFPIALTNF